MRYTEGKGSPRIYRLWSAIFTIGAACERKVWIKTSKPYPTYPNQFIILVGSAGIGKSLCTNMVYNLLNEIRTPETPFYLAPSSVTRASLVDALASAERRIIRPMEIPSVISFNSLTIVPNEFGVFLPAWESDFMSALTDLWDNGRYAETRRTNKIHIEIPNSNLNLLSATTPAYLNSLLPEGAWEFGFMSRILTVFSSELIHSDIFAEFALDDKLYSELILDLKQIYSMYGQMTVMEDVQLALNDWSRTSGRSAPDHPKLLSYGVRRAHHLLKLCMIASIANDSEAIITLDHYAEAVDWLTELETFMPDIFKSMKTGGDAQAMEECWHFIYTAFMRHQKTVPEEHVYKFLSERVPVHSIERMIEAMERGGVIERKFTETGGKGFEPKARKAA